MGSSKSPRHVAVAIIFSPSTQRILMITSRKHPHLWICEGASHLPTFPAAKELADTPCALQCQRAGSKQARALVRQRCERLGRKVSGTCGYVGSRPADSAKLGLPPPSDDVRIMMLALESAKKGKRGAVWHIQVVEVEERVVDAILDW
jgi:diphosphoinositol-polyphosphate diphosphatase